MVTSTSSMDGQQITDPKSTQLEVVPINGGVLSPPPKRYPQRTKVGTEGKEGTSVAPMRGTVEANECPMLELLWGGQPLDGLRAS